jgi:hypothetical protein
MGPIQAAHWLHGPQIEPALMAVRQSRHQASTVNRASNPDLEAPFETVVGNRIGLQAKRAKPIPSSPADIAQVMPQALVVEPQPTLNWSARWNQELGQYSAFPVRTSASFKSELCMDRVFQLRIFGLPHAMQRLPAQLSLSRRTAQTGLLACHWPSGRVDCPQVQS